MRILVAEDDPALQAALAFSLERTNGYAVDVVAEGIAADRYLRTSTCDLVVLDLGLPVLDGFEVLRRLRARDAGLPVLIMSGRHAPHEKVRGLDMGADDYIVKPFSLDEFEARVRALLRRGRSSAGASVVRAGLAFDPLNRTASLDGRTLRMSSRETMVLEVLLAHFGRVVPKEELVRRVYEGEGTCGDNAIEVFVHRVRRKLADSPLTVTTFYGRGYQLDYRARPEEAAR